MLKINVKDQTATKYNSRNIVSGAVNFIDVQFTFLDNSWDGLNKIYQFTNGEISIDIATNENIVTIPHEVLIAGKFSIKLRGTLLDDTNTIIEKQATTNPLYYDVISSELVTSDNTELPTSDIIDQINTTAQSAKNAVDGILNNEFSILASQYSDELIEINANLVELMSDIDGGDFTVNTSEDEIDGGVF